MRIAMVGKSITEYVLILSLVSIIAIPSLMFLGDTVNTSFLDSSNKQKSGVDNLVRLLEPKHWDDTEVTGFGGMLANPYGPTQLVDKVAFDFDAITGQVEVINVGSGSTTTSGEGSLMLVENLQDLLNAYPGVMTPEQETLLDQLIIQGLAIAAEEQRLVDNGIGGFGTGGTITNICGFSCSGDPTQTSIFTDFQGFTAVYDSLMVSMAGSDALTLQMKDTIDINSSLISQLAVQNFIEPQNALNIVAGDTDHRAEIEGAKIKAKNIDIKKIKAKDSATVTADAAKGIGDKSTGLDLDLDLDLDLGL